MKGLLLSLFFLFSLVSFSQKRTYPTTITLNNGNVSYCQNASSTQFTITLGSSQCGNGSNINVTHTERIFVNTTNSTTSGTEVASLSNALFTTNAVYTPPVSSIGVLYYYATVEWTTNGCATGGSLTSNVVSVTVVGQNSSIPFTQGFNGIACGWTIQQVSGTAGAISMVTSATNESTSPNEGTHFINFNSFSSSAGSSTRLQSPNLTVGQYEDIEIKFHWRNSTSSTYATNQDRVVVQWYNGTSWTDIQTYNRPDASLNGWQEKVCQFNTGIYTTIQIGFRFISAYGYNSALDNLTVTKIETPLPVELLYFKGTPYPTFNKLDWSTASESNSDYFEIYESLDGINWKLTGERDAAGFSNQLIYYTLLVPISEFGIHYYHLKQIDYDGNFKIYDAIAINNPDPRKKTIVKYINLIGQEINLENHNGPFLILYDDGSTQKSIK